MEVLVIGCGVSGLSCGIRLQEAGFAVEIWARDLPLETTSSVAAAIWFPYHAEPEDRVRAWAFETYSDFVRLARSDGSGVMLRRGLELFPERQPNSLGWRQDLPCYRRATLAELPANYEDGYEFEAPVIEMPTYLDYLRRRFEQGNRPIRQHPVHSLAEAFEQYNIVVNCTGLGSRELLPDNDVYPARGQILVVEQNSIDRFHFDDSDEKRVTYVIPRSANCVLGGTLEHHKENPKSSEATAQEILKRCVDIEPRLQGIRILACRAGLRPMRSAVRLERRPWAPGKTVIHNYGHGGSGVTLSWGCADEVVTLVKQAAATEGTAATCNPRNERRTRASADYSHGELRLES